MTAVNETGHAKNVANFEKLVSNVTAMGSMYNPAKDSLSLSALNALLASAKGILPQVHAAEAAYKHAISEREVAFKSLSKHITRVNNALKASSSSTRMDESVMTFIRKIQGRRASPKMNDEQKKIAEATGVVKNEISSSQLSFDNRLDYLDKLVKLLESIPEYAPHEAELTTASLVNLHNELSQKNSEVVNAAVALANVRIDRDILLYSALSGMVDISADIKMYVKSLYGASDPHYKAISGLRFAKRH